MLGQEMHPLCKTCAIYSDWFCSGTSEKNIVEEKLWKEAVKMEMITLLVN